MAADKKSSAEDITDQPLHGNGDSSSHSGPDGDRDDEGKPYRTEEFVRVRRQLTERLDRVKDELARLDAEEIGARAADWVKRNPLLAATLAAGTGILLGRGLMSILSKPEPPTLRQRTRAQVRELSHHAQQLAGDLGDVVSDRASDAGDYILHKASEARSELSRKASELSDDIGRRATDLAEAINESTARAAKSTRATAHDTADYVRDRADEGRDAIESFLGTVRTAAADAVVRKMRDIIRRA